jgi:hypothetical protein
MRGHAANRWIQMLRRQVVLDLSVGMGTCTLAATLRSYSEQFGSSTAVVGCIRELC